MKGKSNDADCRSGKRGPFFVSSLAASARAHPHTERAGLVERQRGAGLVSSNRQNANGSTVGGAIPRNQLTGGGVQHQRVIAGAFALNPPGAVAV